MIIQLRTFEQEISNATLSLAERVAISERSYLLALSVQDMSEIEKLRIVLELQDAGGSFEALCELTWPFSSMITCFDGFSTKLALRRTTLLLIFCMESKYVLARLFMLFGFFVLTWQTHAFVPELKPPFQLVAAGPSKVLGFRTGNLGLFLHLSL